MRDAIHLTRLRSVALLLPLLLPLLAACTAGPLDVVNNSLWRGLVAHWSLDETGGATVADDSGNGHHGTLVGGTWIQGHFNGALHFELGNQVSVPAFPAATTQWTVALWVRPPLEDVDSSYATLISTELVFEGGWEMNARLSSGDRRYQFGYYLGPDRSHYYTHNCSCAVMQQWTHLAAVVNGAAGTLAFYRDGLLDLPASLPPVGATLGPIRPGNSTLYMGRWRDPMTPGEPVDLRLLRGDLDDVVVYDRALAQDEVAALARGAVPAPRR